ncbi:MAG: DUF455 family protein [Dehalococcoidia bacterium]
MSKLAEHIKEMPSRREPPYTPITEISDDDRAKLAENLGRADNYEGAQLRELIQADPENLEYKKALLCSIASPEYAGIDAFSRKVCEWQDWDVPWSLIMAIARQTWDESRHANFATQLLEGYGGHLNDYPDTFAGGVQQTNGQAPAVMEAAFNQPATMLSMVNVSLEGRGLTFFEEISKLGHRVGDELLAQCYDYNWADEVTHVTIGDYFVKALTADDPEAEQRALRAHAFFEYMTSQRSSLSEDQTEELKEFFAEEIGRAHAAFAAGNGQS